MNKSLGLVCHSLEPTGVFESTMVTLENRRDGGVNNREVRSLNGLDSAILSSCTRMMWARGRAQNGPQHQIQSTGTRGRHRRRQVGRGYHGRGMVDVAGERPTVGEVIASVIQGVDAVAEGTAATARGEASMARGGDVVAGVVDVMAGKMEAATKE